jgi:hypothetical protein
MEIQYFRVILELTGGELLSPLGYIQRWLAIEPTMDGW